MKTIMGLGVPHVPFITGSPELGDKNQVTSLIDTFHQKRKEIERYAPDLVIIISAEHANKFFLDNVPPFCVGVAQSFDGPSDKGTKLPYAEVPGHERFGERLVKSGIESGFDLAYARQWTMDHGFMLPLYLLTKYAYPIVPIFVNAALPPLPTSKRCFQLGQFIRSVIEQDPEAQNILLIGAGGISHSVGTEDMGMIDETFDRNFLQCLETADKEKLLSIGFDEMEKAGSSTHEILAWIVVAGALFPERTCTNYYAPIKGFATGCAISSWPPVEIHS
jgi:aromatic ring-opening dioxygenase catalytic subunit (LigB family)